MKFSIIVPVYNVEKYIALCLESILEQSYDNFEVIVVNDGSPDGSQKIIDKFVKKDDRIKSFVKKNGGLSDARNYGVKKANGDYILFVDSDDTINRDLLLELNNVANKDIDIIRYQMVKINNDNSYCDKCESFTKISGEEAFIRLTKTSLFVTACSSAYRLDYWNSNKFQYAIGRYHEDFGLTPLVYIKAKYVSCIDYEGYNYYFRENSIMSNNDINKLIKKNEDCLYHYQYLMNGIKDINISNRGIKYYKSFISNAMINRCDILDGKILKEYIKELKNEKVGSNLLDDTLSRKLKKLVFNLCPNFYVKHYVKK